MSLNPDEPRSRARTDFLRDIESEVQRSWDESKVFEPDPGSEPPGPGEKFFGNFPYPYMNGLLHLQATPSRCPSSRLQRPFAICLPLHWDAHQGLS